jgi:hypothetical protein
MHQKTHKSLSISSHISGPKIMSQTRNFSKGFIRNWRHMSVESKSVVNQIKENNLYK